MTDVPFSAVSGTVSPTPDRVMRIERLLPGTAKYYFSPLWYLVENRFYSSQELERCATVLCPTVRNMGTTSKNGVFGREWRNEIDDKIFLGKAANLISDQDIGMDAVTAILIALREAELIQDSAAYLRACKAWAVMSERRKRHPILHYLSPLLLDAVVEPLRKISFFPDEINDLWRQHVENYCEIKCAGINDFEILDCLLQSEF